MMDYSGSATPVAWKGTDEIGYSYGGMQTKNFSFLPAENPEVLYLSLGQVSSRNMHCLFDRNEDMMVKFHKSTQMLRGDDDQLLQISIPASAEMIVMYSDYYTKHLGLPVYEPMDDTHFKNPPVMWNSWTNYYYMVTEEEVIKNVDWIVENFNDYGLEYVVIDDGPERGEDGEHYWISNWNKETFPHGGKWLAEYIRSKGLTPGLWLVPNTYAGALNDHPEWYLRDKDGKHIMVYNTPSLDYTNPEVLDFLTEMFSTLKNWGFEYYKFDAEFALTEYIPYVDRDKLYDKKISQIEAYRNRLKVIWNSVGAETFLEGCPGGTPLQGIGYFNSYFNGDDIYNSWLGMYPFFLSLNANLFLNNIACYLMPGEGICVSPKMDIEKARTVYNPEFIRVASSREKDISSVGTTMNEARTIVTFAALSGTPYSFADRLPDLPEERINLLKKSLPTMPIMPMDLFSRGGYSSWGLFKEFTPETYEHNFPRIVDLKINSASGKYDVVAATNWTNVSEFRNISFAGNLGLDPDIPYLVFDFWNQEFLGLINESVELNIKPHDTRVLHIRPLLQRPQVLVTD
ncbi:MAG: alpha-galactosidase, partial [Bacteroidales bacterium]|nr:alpha-galactosidase [Bacteroidales bacterium]